MGNFCCEQEPKKTSFIQPKSKCKKTSIMLQNSSEQSSQSLDKDRNTDSTEDVNILLATVMRSKVEPVPTHTVNRAGRVSVEDYQKLKLLGKGGFGEVYLVRRTETAEKQGEVLEAMKIVPKKASYMSGIGLQKLVMGTFSSPFLVKMHDCFQDDRSEYIVMEYAALGDLFSFTSESEEEYIRTSAFKSLGEAAVRFIAACVLEALEVLHGNGIIYRDLKLENLLVFQDGYVKLSDFGLAQRAQEVRRGRAAGTVTYLPPEIISKEEYDRSVDLWGLGVLLHQLLFEHSPYNDWEIHQKQTFISRVRNDQKIRIWGFGKVSPTAKNLIQSLLVLDPKKRLGYDCLEDLRKHQFFENFDWASLRSQQMASPLLRASQSISP